MQESEAWTKFPIQLSVSSVTSYSLDRSQISLSVSCTRRIYFQEAPSLGEIKYEDFSQSRKLTLECGSAQRLKW